MNTLWIHLIFVFCTISLICRMAIPWFILNNLQHKQSKTIRSGNSIESTNSPSQSISVPKSNTDPLKNIYIVWRFVQSFEFFHYFFIAWAICKCISSSEWKFSSIIVGISSECHKQSNGNRHQRGAVVVQYSTLHFYRDPRKSWLILLKLCISPFIVFCLFKIYVRSRGWIWNVFVKCIRLTMKLVLRVGILTSVALPKALPN